MSSFDSSVYSSNPFASKNEPIKAPPPGVSRISADPEDYDRAESDYRQDFSNEEVPTVIAAPVNSYSRPQTPISTSSNTTKTKSKKQKPSNTETKYRSQIPAFPKVIPALSEPYSTSNSAGQSQPSKKLKTNTKFRIPVLFLGTGYFLKSSIIWEAGVYALGWSVIKLLKPELDPGIYETIQSVTGPVVVAVLASLLSVLIVRSNENSNKAISNSVEAIENCIQTDLNSPSVQLDSEIFANSLTEIKNQKKSREQVSQKAMSLVAALVTYIIVNQLF